MILIISDSERRARAIQQKLDRLDEAFLLLSRSTSTRTIATRTRLRQELTLLQIDQHADQLEEFDVEGILAFAERGLPRASDLWVQASLAQRQRLQQLFFPDGAVFDGRAFVRTGVSTHAFKYLTPVLPAEREFGVPILYLHLGFLAYLAGQAIRFAQYSRALVR